MGRQLQLATTRVDELELLRFIAGLGPVRVFQSCATTPEALWMENYDKIGAPPWTLYIWPQSFFWVPAYGQIGGPKCPPESVGKFYITNWHAAPILELSRSDLSRGRVGRIYWSRNFSAPHGLNYDADAFSRLVDSVWKWIRKMGKRKAVESNSPYFLPDAWKCYSGEFGGLN